jgi:hypothetical protein
VEAIMGQAFGTEAAVASPPPATMEIPENLSRFFASKAANEASTHVTNCCGPAEQADCCEVAAKESCCEAGASASGECGCRSISEVSPWLS